jgi:hypothetical protein
MFLIVNKLIKTQCCGEREREKNVLFTAAVIG